MCLCVCSHKHNIEELKYKKWNKWKQSSSKIKCSFEMGYKTWNEILTEQRKYGTRNEVDETYEGEEQKLICDMCNK